MSRDSRLSPAATPLSISHLLGWMAGTGIVLSASRLIWKLNSQPETWQTQLREVGFAMLYGAGFSSLGLYLWRWFTGAARGPRQPGHWLLILIGISAVLDMLASVLYAASKVWIAPRNLAFWAADFGLAYFIAFGISFSISFFGHGLTPAWRGVALAAATFSGVQSAILLWIACQSFPTPTSLSVVVLYSRLPHLQAATIALCLVTLVIALYDDRAARRPRDWLHYTGIAMGAGLSFMVLVDYGWRFLVGS